MILKIGNIEPDNCTCQGTTYALHCTAGSYEDYGIVSGFCEEDFTVGKSSHRQIEWTVLTMREAYWHIQSRLV